MPYLVVVINRHFTPTKLHNPNLLNTLHSEHRPRVQRKIWIAVNKFDRSILHLKKENNKSFLELEEQGNTKKGWKIMVIKGLRYRHKEIIQHKTCKLQLVCYRILHEIEYSNCRELNKIIWPVTDFTSKY
ncbi:hypothetical protein TNCV_595331 [Trichonephila clavipes]|nr:hypothetical protein TNCV_595331 [Trichonephila clavipes]